MSNKKQTLFDISDDIMALDELIWENDGDLDNPEVAKVLDKFEAEIMNNLEAKVDNYSAYIKTLMHRAQARSDESERLADRAKTDENAAKNLAERLKYVLIKLNIPKVDTPRYSIAICKNGGKLPLNVDIAPEKLPEEYRTETTTVKANNDSIRAALESGQKVPGCSFGERGVSLRIR